MRRVSSIRAPGPSVNQNCARSRGEIGSGSKHGEPRRLNARTSSSRTIRCAGEDVGARELRRVGVIAVDSSTLWWSNESCGSAPGFEDLPRSGIILRLSLLHDLAGASLRPRLDARGDLLHQDRDPEGHLPHSESYRKPSISLGGPLHPPGFFWSHRNPLDEPSGESPFD